MAHDILTANTIEITMQRPRTLLLWFLSSTLIISACSTDQHDASADSTAVSVESTSTSSAPEEDVFVLPNKPQIDRSFEPGSLDDPFPFYGNVDRIEKTMAKVPGAQKKEPGSGSSALSYTGGRFADVPVNAWDFGFYGGQMTFAQLQIRTEDAGMKLEDLYEKLSAELTDRYGEKLFDSDKQVSRNLTKYTDAEQAFIEKVGLSFPGGKFRMWTPTDSTVDMLTSLNMLPADATLQDGILHLTWYDRLQSEAYFNAVQR